jgi:hypothetical protein
MRTGYAIGRSIDDNAKAESFMKTLKVEAVYPMEYKTSVRKLESGRARHETRESP